MNAKGEHLGKIEDFMIDIQKGQIVFRCIIFWWHFRYGKKLFAIPWELLCIDSSWITGYVRQRIVFNIPKEVLEKALALIKITGQ
jgi:hypothetical protein